VTAPPAWGEGLRSRSVLPDLLDDAASALFGDEPGRTRLEPLLRQWEQEVGTIREDDHDSELLHEVRTDWALMDATTPSWLRRALRGELDGVRARDEWQVLLGSHVGLFEVWPGSRAWLRDVRCGLSLELEDPVRVEPLPQGGPGALWEVRVVVHDGRARMCRRPLAYPVELLPDLHEVNRRRFVGGGGPVSLLRLRRHWLQFHRAPRAEPAAVFRIR
jgi:hypothetical protein